MKVEAGGYIFDFKKSMDAFIFDETDKSKPTYHGAPMKGVDVIVELDEAYLFVEVKHYEDLTEFILSADDEHEVSVRKQDHHRWLKNYLKYKFRDTYLYRHAEQKVDKPIHYLCLINFDNALNSFLKKNLKKELPVGKPTRRWLLQLAESCQILNLAEWNKAFPNWEARYAGSNK